MVKSVQFGENNKFVETTRQKIRWYALEQALSGVSQLLGPETFLVQGSVATGCLLTGQRRTPNDLDLIVGDADLLAGIAGRVVTTDNCAVKYSAGGEVPFRSPRNPSTTYWFLVDVSMIGGSSIDRFLLEATCDERKMDFTNNWSGKSILIEGWQVRVLPRCLQLADKYHAYMRKREGGRINMRWVDLADTVLLLRGCSTVLTADEVSKSRDFVLSSDTASQLNTTPPRPPVEWAAEWRKLRELMDGALPEMEGAWDVFCAFWDDLPTSGIWCSEIMQWSGEKSASIPLLAQ